jgi:glycerol-3-phosphate acyltransferase PlsY
MSHVTVDTWSIAAVGATAYLIGGIPIGWLLARNRGVDVRNFGSGNVGTSNIFRNVDTGLAVVVGPAQFLQGLLCVQGAAWLGFPLEIQALVAVCAVLGNGWPVYLGFNGGRGIAVATGAVAGLSLLGLGVLLACFAVGALFHQIALGVLGGFGVLPLVAALVIGPARAIAFAVLLVLIVLRRLEGLLADTRRYGQPWRLAMLRLALDQRPGRPLVGRRTD